jgi:sugar lactone lactonase YvrE
MTHYFSKAILVLAAAFIGAIAMQPVTADAQDNPYRLEPGWAKYPAGRKWGSTSAVDVDREGNIWAFERCGARDCSASNLDTVFRFDRAGNVLTSFGANLFVFPHGMHVDRQGNVFATDADGKAGKGHTVVKFSPQGKVLMTLGKQGVAGAGDDVFNRPSAVTTAANGDIYVADGHGGESNARVMKFSKDGKFIKSFGKKGKGRGELDELHAIAIDSRGRVFVGDRGNGAIKIFDADGNLLDEWKQFGRPSGIFIDANDTIYVADSQSDAKRNPGFRRGIRIGSAKDGSVRAHIPGVGPEPDKESVPEGVAADKEGNVYGAETTKESLQKYVKK